MIAAIRIKGSVGARGEVEDTLRMLGMKKKFTLVLLQKSDTIIGMVKKAEHMMAWGEIDSELLKEIKEKYGSEKIRLKPPKKGLRSVKSRYPKGDLGYRGAAINELIKRMM